MQRRKVEPESETRKAVRAMWARDKSAREIADALGISTQRVYQQLNRIRITAGGKPAA